MSPEPCRAAAVILLALASTACIEPARVAWEGEAGGLPAAGEVYATSARIAEALRDEIGQALRRAELALSADHPDSELVALNRSAGAAPYEVGDADLERCIKLAVNWARSTDGAFDPTLGALTRLYGRRGQPPRDPTDAEVREALGRTGWRQLARYPEAAAVRFRIPGMELDLDRIREGYALDMAARNFARTGSRAGLLRLGGVVYAWQAPPGRDAWPVAVLDPSDWSQRLGTLELANRALSVSGTLAPLLAAAAPAARPILDPASGRPADTDLLAAVAVADTGADAQAFGTSLYVLGSQAGANLLDRAIRVEALLVVRGSEGPYVLASGSLRGRFELDPGLAERLGGPVRFLLPPASFP